MDCGQNLIHEIVSACIKRGIFSEELFNKYQILTSRGIQKRYLAVTAKRRKSEIKKEYSLVKVTHVTVNDGKNLINDGRNRVNDVDNTQSKVKERKVNNNTHASEFSDPFEGEDDDGIDPMEALRIWKEAKKKE